MNKQELDFLTRFVEESDGIEGIGNIPSALRRQFDEEHNPKRTGHAGALLRLRDYAMITRTPLTERMVKEVQRLITAEQHLKGADILPVEQRGHWRMCNMRFPPESSKWQNVPADMAAWIALAAFAKNVRDIAFLHWRYERIHPFADGNGRSGRALVYYLYRWAGLRPFVFTSGDKHDAYYPCLQQNTWELMERYFLERSGS
jgi:Fic family protein